MYVYVICNSMQLKLCMIAIVPRRYDIPGYMYMYLLLLTLYISCYWEEVSIGKLTYTSVDLTTIEINAHRM